MTKLAAPANSEMIADSEMKYMPERYPPPGRGRGRELHPSQIRKQSEPEELLSPGAANKKSLHER